MLAGFLMEWMGRLNTIKLAALPCCVGWAMIALSNNVFWIIFGRILTGLACAVGTSPAIVYITEVARPDLRSSLISAGPTLASLGNYCGSSSLSSSTGITKYCIHISRYGDCLRKGRIHELENSSLAGHRVHYHPSRFDSAIGTRISSLACIKGSYWGCGYLIEIFV